MSRRRGRAADGKQVIDWAMAMADAQLPPGFQGLPHEGFGAAYGLSQGHTLGEQGGDGGGERAPRAMGMGGV